MTVELHTLPGIPLVKHGDDLIDLIAEAMVRGDLTPRRGDIFVLAQKIVSKSEGRLVELATVKPSLKAHQLALRVEKDPRLVELVLQESRSIVLAKPGSLLVEHRLGFVMPMAGIDQSNIGSVDGAEKALLLPYDPDSSAELLRTQLALRFSTRSIAVVINDSVSRAWRNGTCGVAIGSAGLTVLKDLRGDTDLLGRKLQHSVTSVADEIAAAASLVMGQADEGTPIVLLRGLKWQRSADTASELLLRPSEGTPELVELL